MCLPPSLQTKIFLYPQVSSPLGPFYYGKDHLIYMANVPKNNLPYIYHKVRWSQLKILCTNDHSWFMLKPRLLYPGNNCPLTLILKMMLKPWISCILSCSLKPCDVEQMLVDSTLINLLNRQEGPVQPDSSGLMQLSELIAPTLTNLSFTISTSSHY